MTPYDAVGNRTSETHDGSELSFTYDDNNKLTYVEATSPTASATLSYDDNGNMTSVTGTLYENKTLVCNDESRMSSITYGGVTDTYTYNWEGLRTRARLKYGLYHRYLYNGQRVLQDLTNAGAVNATCTTENDSYCGALLHLKRATGETSLEIALAFGVAREETDWLPGRGFSTQDLRSDWCGIVAPLSRRCKDGCKKLAPKGMPL